MKSLEKKIGLTFRGFECAPSEIEALLGVTASSTGMRGQPPFPTVKRLLTRSVASFDLRMSDDTPVAEYVPLIIEYLGGIGKLHGVNKAVSPEFLEFDIYLPVRRSEVPPGCFLPVEVMSMLVDLDATVGIQFDDPVECG